MAELVRATNKQIPDVVFPAPPCPVCRADLAHDADGFECRDCGLCWNHDGQDPGHGGDVEEVCGHPTRFPIDSRASSTFAWARCQKRLGHKSKAHAGFGKDHADGDEWDQWDSDGLRVWS